jgi:hypothetical protein
MSVDLSPEEKALYKLVGYGLVWLPLDLAGQHWFTPAVGAAAAGFLWVLGFWFLPFTNARKRTSFVGWLGRSILFAIAAFCIRYALDRAFGAG